MISQNEKPNVKIAGLSALTVIASSLKEDVRNIHQYYYQTTMSEKLVLEITQPMVDCFHDKLEQIRFSAIEQLYYCCKSLNEIILLNFNSIFEELILRSLLESNEDIKKAIKTFTVCLKGIITQALPERRYFKFSTFIPIFQNTLKSKNSTTRLELLNWLSTINSIPNTEVYEYLPMILEPLFDMLNDTNKEVKEKVAKLINELQRETEIYSEKSIFKEDQAYITHSSIVQSLVLMCSDDKYSIQAKIKSLNWIKEYMRLFSQHSDSRSTRSSSSLSLSNYNKWKDHFIDDNLALKKAIMINFSSILEQTMILLGHDDDQISKISQKIDENLYQITESLEETSDEFNTILKTVEKLLNERKKLSTSQSAIKWMHYLLRSYSIDSFPVIDRILSNLIERLYDNDNQIDQLIDLLGRISLHDQYYDLVLMKILNVFFTDVNVLSNKSELIISQLCRILNPQRVFKTISVKLIENFSQEPTFISKIVQSLESIILSQPNLKELRSILKNLKYEKDLSHQNKDFFYTLFNVFCFNQVSTITLCLLAQEYELAYQIVKYLSLEEQDKNYLVQATKLLTLINSPVFAYLRLQTLEPQKYYHLIKTIQGLSLLLPILPKNKRYGQRFYFLKLPDLKESDKYIFWKYVVNPTDQKFLFERFKQTSQKINFYQTQIYQSEDEEVAKQ